MLKWMYYFHSSGSLESKNFVRSWLQMLPEKNKQTKITEWGYLLRDHHKFNCCWHSVHLTMFLLEQADPKGMLQAVARKKWISNAGSPGNQRRVSTWSKIFNCHWALREVEQGENFVEERHFSLFSTDQGRGGRNPEKNVQDNIPSFQKKTGGWNTEDGVSIHSI